MGRRMAESYHHSGHLGLPHNHSGTPGRAIPSLRPSKSPMKKSGICTMRSQAERDNHREVKLGPRHTLLSSQLCLGPLKLQGLPPSESERLQSIHLGSLAEQDSWGLLLPFRPRRPQHPPTHTPTPGSLSLKTGLSPPNSLLAPQLPSHNTSTAPPLFHQP